MKINTKFKVDDDAFTIANNVIKKVRIRKINIEVTGEDKANREITYTLSKGSKSYFESELGLTPQETVDRMLNKYRRLHPEDFEYENEDKPSAVDQTTGDRTSALEIDDPDAEDEEEDEDDIGANFLKEYTDIDDEEDEEDEEEEEDEDEEPIF